VAGSFDDHDRCVGTVLAPAHEGGEFRIRLDESYLGHLSSTFRLDTGGGCFVNQDRLKAGQRIFFVSFWGDRVPVDMGDLWFLDRWGHVTGVGTQAFDDHFRAYRTLDELLAAMGLPDTAMSIPLRSSLPDTAYEPDPPPTPLGAADYIFLAIIVGLIVMAAFAARARR
jgi:hypothetical protein